MYYTRNLLEEAQLNREKQQQIFNAALHSDMRGGKVFLLSMLNGQVQYEVASGDLSNLITPGTDGNTYISLNTFNPAATSRVAANVYNVGSFYFDFDGHSLSDTELTEAKKNTIQVLRQAVENELFCPWSMVTDTGRGLGVYILLNQSIPAYGKGKALRFYDAIYRMLLDRLDMIFDSTADKVLDIDRSIKDRARICRLPGTYNHKAHKWCTLMEYNVDPMEEVLRFGLWDIVNHAGLSWEKKEKTMTCSDPACSSDVKEEKPASNIFAYLSERQRKLELLQTLRENWEGNREYFCFIYYNCVKQLFPREQAVSLVCEVNRNFKHESLSDIELYTMIRSVDAHVSPSGDYSGYYRLSELWICDMLCITPEEKSICKFGQKTEDILRHERVVANRIDLHQEVIAAIIKCSSWQEVSDITTVPLRTVKAIGKKYHCTMRKKLNSVNDIDWNAEKERQLVGKQKKTKMKKEKSPKKTTAQVESIDFSAICMDISEDDEFEDIPAVAPIDMRKYGYGLSFLSYVMDHTDGYLHQTVMEFADTLSQMSNMGLREDLLKTLCYLASEYTESPVIEAAAYDIESLLIGMRSNRYRLRVHGRPGNATFLQNTYEYPEKYEPVASLKEKMQRLLPYLNFAQDAYESVIHDFLDVYNRIKSYCAADGKDFLFNPGQAQVKVKRGFYLQKINRLGLFDLVKMIQGLFVYQKTYNRFPSMELYMRRLWQASQKAKPCSNDVDTKKVILYLRDIARSYESSVA